MSGDAKTGPEQEIAKYEMARILEPASQTADKTTTDDETADGKITINITSRRYNAVTKTVVTLLFLNCSGGATENSKLISDSTFI